MIPERKQEEGQRRSVLFNALLIPSLAVIFAVLWISTYSMKKGSSKTYLATENRDVRRVISIFGLESSGTTFLYDTLSTALNAKTDIHGMTARNIKDGVEVHHISEPWGSSGNSTKGFTTLPYVPPPRCISFYRKYPRPRTYPMHCPKRFFVNITSHVEWYRNRGVDCTAVIITRDQTAHLEGKRRHIDITLQLTAWHQVAKAEDRYGLAILIDAIKSLSRSISPNGNQELILVSYETLLFLRKEYLFQLYNKLGIENTYIPTFYDANAKYFNGT